MSMRGDDLWQRMVDDARPRARELGTTERRLAQLHGGSIGAAEPYLARVLVRPVRPRRGLLALATGALLIVGGITSAAWVSTPLIWPTAEQAAQLPPDYGAALRIARDEKADPKRLREVLGLLDERCAMLIAELREHVQADPRLAAHGARLRAELLAELAHGSAAATDVSEEQFAAVYQASKSALRDGTDARARATIMDGLRDAALPGLGAVQALDHAGIEVEGGIEPVRRLRDSLGSIAVAH